jgi:hypothetical protein
MGACVLKLDSLYQDKTLALTHSVSKDGSATPGKHKYFQRHLKRLGVLSL